MKHLQNKWFNMCVKKELSRTQKEAAKIKRMVKRMLKENGITLH